MNTYNTCLYLLVFVLLSIIFIFIQNYYNSSIIESLSNKDYVVLMGDSIFKNDPYVNRGDSVGDILQNKHGNVLVVAEDNAVINDLKYQLSIFFVS